MMLIRVGHRILNVEYLVLVEDSALEPELRTLPDGVIRITVSTGQTFDLCGDDAERLRAFLEGCLEPLEGDRVVPPSRPSGSQGRALRRTASPKTTPTRE